MSKLRTVSWVLLVVVGALVLFGAAASAFGGYRGDFAIAGVSIADIAAGNEPLLLALRGVRGTAAAWSAAWAVLFLVVVLGPYRRGDVAAWWGILLSTVVLAAVASARVLVGARAGIEAPITLLVIVLIALLLDLRRLRRAA